MAEEPLGLTVAEKFFGLIIIIIGAIIFYVSYMNFKSLLYPFVFLIVGSALIGLGVILVLSRAE